MQLNALASSQNIPPTCILLSRAHKISSNNLYKALSFHRPFLNPNCSSVRILSEFKKSVTCLYIPLSSAEIKNALSEFPFLHKSLWHSV
jgi:hypothetical protein